MAEASVERFESLFTPQGRQLLDHLAQEAVTPDTALRLGTVLRERYPAELVVESLAQHELRLQAVSKFTRAMEMFFTRPGLEQASAEVVARHRARRYAAPRKVADLCTGIGGDLITLAEGRQVMAVDRDPPHVRIAQANAEVYGVAQGVTPMVADVRDVDLAGAHAVFIDPARRTSRGRLPAGESEPPLEWCLNLETRIDAVGIKAAPGLPHEAVPPGWELEFIAIGRDLKEAVVWSPALAQSDTRATILPEGHTLLPEPGEAVPARMPGEFLLDPNPAVTRAGLVEELARSLSAWKIDDRIAFLSAGVAVRTPFGRTLRVIDSAPGIRNICRPSCGLSISGRWTSADGAWPVM